MKHNLIKTDNYLLVVDDSDTRKGDWCYAILSKQTFENINPNLKDNDKKKIISHLPLNGAPYLDGVDRLPPMDNGEDVDKLAREEILYNDDKREWWKQGYNKFREKYKFTEEDARHLIMYSFLKGVDRGHYSKEIEDRIIQTIQQPKLPVAFECEMELVFYPANMPKEGEERPPYRPKTITNSEGRIEWVGKYVY